METDSIESAVSSPVEEERTYLHELSRVVDANIQRLDNAPRYFPEDSEEPQTADEVAQQAVDMMRDVRAEQLRAARSEPYFGRIDFAENGQGSREPLRIGKRGIEDSRGDRLVIDWRAPVASMFYSFSGKGSTAAYESPDGRIEGEIYLKRNVQIRQRELQRVVDSYVYGQEDDAGITDEFLLYRLSEQKDSRLRDIVSTIQAEQDKIIRADRQLAVVIQGVAGSGKTTVALHRVAYLLYQHAERMKAERMVIFAPNAMFVDYISDVLPELGVGGIQQTTFACWAVKMLGNTVEVQDPGRRLATWFSTRKSTSEQAAYEAAKMKGSESFQNLLDLQVHRLDQSALPEEDFVPWDGAVLAAETIRAWFTGDYRQLPLYGRRERVLARVKRWYEMEYRKVAAADASGKRKKTAASRYRAYAKKWTPVSALDLYRQAWEQAKTLGFSNIGDMGKGKRPKVEVEDLAGLLYLHIRLHGMEGVDRFDHVVIDEAQDFSPLQIAVLQACCPSGSFTILGDLAQSIHTYHGITDWRSFLDQFEEGKAAFFQLDVSYRSTMEIIEFANRILASFPGFQPAKPVFRSGKSVQLRHASREERLELAVSTVRGWQPSANTIAVVTRDDGEAEAYHRALVDAGIASHWIRSDQQKYAGGISVLPIYLTKGLEFDAVLLVDVDATNYPATPENAKLLYVGCSRALHDLALHFTGTPSPLVREPSV